MKRTSTREINVKHPNFSNRTIGIINYEKHFLNFTADIMSSKFYVGIKTLYGDSVYKFMNLIGKNDSSFQFRKIKTRYRRIGDATRQSACLVFHQIIVDNCAAFFNCTPVGRA